MLSHCCSRSLQGRRVIQWNNPNINLLIDNNASRWQRRWVDGGLGCKLLPGYVDFVFRVFQHVVCRDVVLLSCLLIKVVDISKADELLQSKAVSSGSGAPAVDAIAIDRFTAPRPDIAVDVVVLERKLNQEFLDASLLLLDKSLVTEEASFLKDTRELK